MGSHRQPIQPDFPFRPAAFPFYHGWIILGVSTVGLVMSAPGQTIGVLVFTQSLLRVTGLTRIEFSNAYLMGTLASGLMLRYAGMLIDRFGVRLAVIWASIGLALALTLLSQIDLMAVHVAGIGITQTTAGFALLTLGFFGLRLAGQGVLTLACRTMLGR